MLRLPGCKPNEPLQWWLDLFRSARVPACKKYQPVNWGEKRGITLDANSSGQIMMFHQPIEFLEISGFRFPCCLLRWCQTWGRYLVDQIYCSGWRLSRTSWILYPILAISPWPQLLLSIPKKNNIPKLRPQKLSRSVQLLAQDLGFFDDCPLFGDVSWLD